MYFSSIFESFFLVGVRRFFPGFLARRCTFGISVPFPFVDTYRIIVQVTSRHLQSLRLAHFAFGNHLCKRGR